MPMIHLSELTNLLVHEISQAESRVVEGVPKRIPRAKEDNITALFAWETEQGLKDATDTGRVQEAVRTDLESGYYSHGLTPPFGLHRISDGIVARLRPQPPTDEIKTGGDFGLLLVEPQFQFGLAEQLDLRRRGLKQGLLVQAKRRRRDGSWNSLTRNQCEKLPRRMDYAVLLRYEFADDECQNLQAFSWHPLLGQNLADVEEWLRRGDFPAAVRTPELVASLSRSEFGTEDLEIIEREICPDAGRCVIIEIDWADGEDPGALLESVNWEVAERAHRTAETVNARAGS